MELGNFFPQDLQDFRFNDKIKVGSVIKYFVEDTNPPKYKRMIVIGVSGNKISVATIYINSKLNTGLFKNKRMQALQIRIEQEEREYLEHDSYVDCSFLHIKQIDKLNEEFKNNRLESLGEVSENDLNLIKGTLISADTISFRQKKDYGLIKI